VITTRLCKDRNLGYPGPTNSISPHRTSEFADNLLTTLKLLKRIVSIKHNLIYSLIIIKLATCFDPAGSSSGLHYEPVNVKKTAYIFGIPTVFTKDERKRFVSSDL
jgi:hypothetical protein